MLGLLICATPAYSLSPDIRKTRFLLSVKTRFLLSEALPPQLQSAVSSMARILSFRAELDMARAERIQKYPGRYKQCVPVVWQVSKVYAMQQQNIEVQRSRP
jgi:hypothetical protein